MRFLDATFTQQFSRRCRHRYMAVSTLTARWRNGTNYYAQLRTTPHNSAQLRAMVDFIFLSIQFVFMVIGFHIHGFFITSNSMILYFKHIMHIDDFPHIRAFNFKKLSALMTSCRPKKRTLRILSKKATVWEFHQRIVTVTCYSPVASISYRRKTRNR